MRLDEIAALLSCEVEGDGSTEVVGVATLQEARKGDLSFLANPKYYAESKTTKASALIVGRDYPYSGLPLLRHDNPYLMFARALAVFQPPPDRKPGIHPTAVISRSARLGADVEVRAHAFVGEGVEIGDRVTIGVNCVVEDRVLVGNDVILHAGCVIKQGVRIGNRCVVQSNAVVGADGFGYAKADDGTWYPIAQTGTVIVEDDTDIGAGATIDRPALGETRVGRGTKIDNLVHIGHACKVGSNCLLCAQVGLAGSTRLGDGVILAGQVGVAGHLVIGDGAIATPQTGVAASIEAGATVSGSPAVDHRLWLKCSSVYSRLPDLQKTLRDLGRRVRGLEATLKVSSEQYQR